MDTNLKDSSFEKLARGSYYLILDNIVTVALGAVFWVTMAKLVDPSILGQTMVLIGVATSVIAFTGTAIQVTISKYVSEYNAKMMHRSSQTVIRLGLKIGLLVSIAISLVISLLSERITTLAYQNPALGPLLILAVLAFVPSQTVVLALMGAFQGSQRMKYTLFVDLLYQISRIALAILLVYFGLSNLGILVAFSAASIVSSIVGYLYYIPRLFPKSQVRDKEEQEKPGWHIVKFSGFNYVASGMRTLSVQMGILILGTQNFEMAAFYGVSVLITSVVGGVLTAVSRAILPTASEEWTKGNKEELSRVFNTGIRISLLLSGFGLLIVLLDPKQVLGLISQSYVQAFEALRILSISTIVGSIAAIMISIINATGKPGAVAKIELSSSLVIIALTFALAPTLGLHGAAIAMLTGSSLNLALASWILRKQGIRISTNSMAGPSIAIIVGLALGLSLSQLSVNVLITIPVAVVTYWAISLAIKVTGPSEFKILTKMLFRLIRA
jgi:O-antigen/teichoic acid export membrane protein